jgi:hypothetical protein
MTVFWDWLRLTRSDPPGAAKSDPVAAATYRAALEQFEELLDAAASVGYPARPLPLFYALSQAGRAIVAARGGVDHQVHGLTLDRNIPTDLLEATVDPQNQSKSTGQFEAVAASILSPVVNEPVQLGALIHSLPEMSVELASSTDWPKALPLFIRPWERVRTAGQTQIALVMEEEGVAAADLGRFLGPYPNGNRVGINEVVARSFPTLPTSATPRGPGVDLVWLGDEANLNLEVPQYRFRGWRWLRPSITLGELPPSPLMTWWILLFGLSMLARYHPVPWTRALDVDSSSVAVTLELTMNRAIDALPHLVFEALMNVSITLPPRDSYDPFS